ncbi:MAG: DegT/DnrJ/EryC1/StrS family aminotransferase [Deltaproteobacteria bacterium]|nr:DegT/DnrJ/EryC1/StrS family aminotransferase [Deltaproteobacteria bacterium]MBW2535951.1 DegT/DnrJ/EryC1/StrS family aminotransferase [Deltaproteobacteria bacterium]
MGLADFAAEYRERGVELAARVAEVARSGRFVLGPAVASFEQALARAAGLGHAVGVACGTDALVLALRAVGVGPGDVVVTTPLSFVATAEAVVRVGARPRFVDVDPSTLCLDPEQVEAYLHRCGRGGDGQVADPTTGGRVAALLPVHLFGRVADVARLGALGRQVGAPVVEDAAQAVSARAGATPLGRHGPVCVSFFPTKNLGAWGDGGAVLCDDGDVAALVRSLRVHGVTEAGTFAQLGYNSRLDALQAAVLEAKLGWLADLERRRQANAARYRRRLASIARPDGLRLPDPLCEGDVVHQFTVRVPPSWRQPLRGHLDRAGIDTAVYYPRLLCDQPALAESALVDSDLPAARAASDEVLSLPVHPYLSTADIDRVADAVAELVASKS